MPKNWFILLFIFCFVTVTAQKTIHLKGTIVDQDSRVPIESATVYLTNPKDSTVIEYTISQKNGTFDFALKKSNGPVILKISFVAYQDYKVTIKNLMTSQDLGIIGLQPAAQTLDEVVIKNETPPIRIKKDTLEFNAASFKVRPDANVEALLKQLPGVEIDAEGKITVNGKEVNQILVNGKPFFDRDGKIALQNLPSSMINKVQVTDTKTKQEEKTGAVAASNNASINLTIDEKKNKGWFGKVMAGAGSSNRYESSGLVNYFNNNRKISVLASSNNINATGFSMDEIFDNMGGGRNSNVWMGDNGSFFVNRRRFGGNTGITQSHLAGVNYADEWRKDSPLALSYFFSEANTRNNSRTRQINFLPSGNYETASEASYKNVATAHNFSGDIEWAIDSTFTVVMEPKWSRTLGQSTNVSRQESRDALAQLLNESNASSISENTATSFENSTTFTKSFRRKGRNVALVFYQEHQQDDAQNLVDSQTLFYQNSQPDDVRNQRNTSYNRVNQFSYDLKFYEPVKDSLRWVNNVYHEFTNEKNGRDSQEFDPVTNDFTQANPLLTNAMRTKQQVFRPTTGLVLEKSVWNASFNVGPQWSTLNASMDYLGVTTPTNRTFFVPYVEATLNLRLSKSRNIWATYSYDNELPRGSQVLPVEDLANPLNTTIGNPNLEASLRHYFYVSFRDFDYASRSGYGFYGGGNVYPNQIVSATTFDASRKRTTTYTNVSGTYNSWTGLYWNKTYKKEAHKFRYELRWAMNFGLSKGITDGNAFEARTVTLNPRVNFTYEYGERLIINPSYQFTRNITEYTNYVVNAATNYLHRVNLQTTLFWPTNWVFGNDFGYTYNSNIADGFRKDFYLWNTSLAYSFYQKRFTAKVKVYDVLNQNQNATRTITATAIRDEENVVLRRYVMFSLTYKLAPLDKEKQKGRRQRR